MSQFDDDLEVIVGGEFTETALGNDMPLVEYPGGSFEIDCIFDRSHTSIDPSTGAEYSSDSSVAILSSANADSLYGGTAFENESLNWRITIRGVRYKVADPQRSEGMITLILRKP